MSVPTLPEFARILNGQIVSGGVSFAPPGHHPKDRSGRLFVGPQYPAGFWVETFSPADDPIQVRDHVAGLAGIATRPERAPEPSPVDRMAALAKRAEAEKADAADKARRTRRSLEVWNGAVDPRGTIVGNVYLPGRALDLPAEIAGPVIRFAPRCPWKDEDGVTRARPAMVALMRDVLTGEPKAIHRTLLSDDGQKLDRRMMGPSGGTAIMFDKPGAVLVAGEGIESALSARQLGFGPTWALGSAGEISKLPVVPDVERVLLLEELGDGGASAKAVKACGLRWTAAAHEVASILPKIGHDMNDSLRGIAR